MSYANPHFLVETDWLEKHLGEPNLRIIDCRVDMSPVEGGGLRFDPAKGAWEEDHIPGATFVDFSVELSDHAQSLPFMLPSARDFTEVMSGHGVGDGTRVILYDSFMNMWAARLWWMLRAYGFDDAAVLNGGWTKWKKEGRETSSEEPAVARAKFVPRPRRGTFVSREDVQNAIEGSATCLLDALPPEHYRGEFSFGYDRKGHIRSAVNLPCAELVDPETHAYLEAEPLRARLRKVGAISERPVITYCGAAIAASSAAFALALLGHDNVAIYDGSLSEWTQDPNLPMDSGER